MEEMKFEELTELKEPERLLESAMPFQKLIMQYQCALLEVKTKFEVLNHELSINSDQNPILSIESRIKKPISILEKMKRKNIEISVQAIEENICDIAGIRVICCFPKDIYTLAEKICEQDDIRLIERKDYIKNPKESGYRSYHLIVHYEVETVKGTTIIPVEIQIRTLGMNFWAIIEHSLQYKYNGEIPAHVKERLNAASDALITLDNEMSSIHDEIINSQTYFMVKANIVSDILSTIQNLYKVANKQVIIKIQDEFYEIFEKGDVNELSRFSRQLDIIAEDYRAQSVQ